MQQKRRRSASLYAFCSQFIIPLLHVYMSYTPLDCKNAPIFSTVEAKKKICVLTMEKLNRVGRSENVSILLKKLLSFVWPRKNIVMRLVSQVPCQKQKFTVGRGTEK